MSASARMLRRAGALACAAALGLPASASAATYGPVGCSLNHGYACASTQRHTYDDNRATASNWALVGSWLVNPSTGTNINVVYGAGAAYAYYRANGDLWLDGYWGNYSGTSPVWVNGTFNY